MIEGPPPVEEKPEPQRPESTKSAESTDPMEALKREWEKGFDTIEKVEEVRYLGSGAQGSAYRIRAQNNLRETRVYAVKTYKERGGKEAQESGTQVSLAAKLEKIPHLAAVQGRMSGAVLLEYAPDYDDEALDPETKSTVSVLRATQTIDFLRTKTGSEWTMLDFKRENLRLNPRTNELKIIDLDSATKDSSAAKERRRSASISIMSMLDGVEEMEDQNLRRIFSEATVALSTQSVGNQGEIPDPAIAELVESKEFNELPESLKLLILQGCGLTEGTKDFEKEEEFSIYCERIQYLFLSYLAQKHPESLEIQNLPPILQERIKKDREKHNLEKMDLQEFLSTAVNFHVNKARKGVTVKLPENPEWNAENLAQSRVKTFLKVTQGLGLPPDALPRVDPTAPNWTSARIILAAAISPERNTMSTDSLERKINAIDARLENCQDPNHRTRMLKKPFESALEAVEKELANSLSSGNAGIKEKQGYLRALVLHGLVTNLEVWKDVEEGEIQALFSRFDRSKTGIQSSEQKWDKDIIERVAKKIISSALR
jgi:hypothetical protein